MTRTLIIGAGAAMMTYGAGLLVTVWMQTTTILDAKSVRTWDSQSAYLDDVPNPRDRASAGVLWGSAGAGMLAGGIAYRRRDDR